MQAVEPSVPPKDFLHDGFSPSYFPTPVGEFGLSERALRLLRDVWAAEPAVNEAIIYGSRAKGNFHTGSDIDIALNAPALGFDGYQRLCVKVDDLNLPWEVDLALLSHIQNQKLLDHIARVGRPMWIRPIHQD